MLLCPWLTVALRGVWEAGEGGSEPLPSTERDPGTGFPGALFLIWGKKTLFTYQSNFVHLFFCP